MTSALEEWAAFLAFHHKREGKKATDYIFDMALTHRSSTTCYENNICVVPELRSMGLTDAANDIEAKINTMPHVWDLPFTPSCPSEKGWHDRQMEKAKADWKAKQH